MYSSCITAKELRSPKNDLLIFPDLQGPDWKFLGLVIGFPFPSSYLGWNLVLYGPSSPIAVDIGWLNNPNLLLCPTLSAS